jgi:hypothetical protein
MNRLTKKVLDNYESIANSDIIKDKLGRLEDIEEQLGCQLEVVFKALKQDYIFTKSGKHSRLEFGTYGFEWCICYELRTQIRVADYKKTWWLRKDKSE